MIQNKPKVYFKQYGAQRTGSNYIRRLLELNFSNIVIFSNTLGWKHGLFHLKSYRNSEQASSYLDWIEKKYNPETDRVLCSDNYPTRYSKFELQKACINLNYIISYRPISSYVYSYKNFRFPKKNWQDINVEQICKEYIEDYKIWFSLPNIIKINSLDLLEEEKLFNILDNIKNIFDLQLKNKNLINETKIVKASTDGGPVVEQNSEFDKSLYLEKKYLELIPSNVKKIISKYVIF
jgi:hypothetical protein